MANGWTPERRAKQSAAIRQWQPWAKSTGPITQTGKAVSSRNAYKGEWRESLRKLSAMLKQQKLDLDLI